MEFLLSSAPSGLWESDVASRPAPQQSSAQSQCWEPVSAPRQGVLHLRDLDCLLNRLSGGPLALQHNWHVHNGWSHVLDNRSGMRTRGRVCWCGLHVLCNGNGLHVFNNNWRNFKTGSLTEMSDANSAGRGTSISTASTISPCATWWTGALPKLSEV